MKLLTSMSKSRARISELFVLSGRQPGKFIVLPSVNVRRFIVVHVVCFDAVFAEEFLLFSNMF
jgi:hypothetical protein